MPPTPGDSEMNGHPGVIGPSHGGLQDPSSNGGMGRHPSTTSADTADDEDYIKVVVAESGVALCVTPAGTSDSAAMVVPAPRPGQARSHHPFAIESHDDSTAGGDYVDGVDSDLDSDDDFMLNSPPGRLSVVLPDGAMALGLDGVPAESLARALQAEVDVASGKGDTNSDGDGDDGTPIQWDAAAAAAAAPTATIGDGSESEDPLPMLPRTATAEGDARPAQGDLMAPTAGTKLPHPSPRMLVIVETQDVGGAVEADATVSSAMSPTDAEQGLELALDRAPGEAAQGLAVEGVEKTKREVAVAEDAARAEEGKSEQKREADGETVPSQFSTAAQPSAEGHTTRGLTAAPASAPRHRSMGNPPGSSNRAPSTPEEVAQRQQEYQAFMARRRRPSTGGAAGGGVAVPPPTRRESLSRSSRPRSFTESAVRMGAVVPLEWTGNPFAVAAPRRGPLQAQAPSSGAAKRISPRSRSGSVSSISSPKLSAHDSGMCQKLGLTPTDFEAYDRAWRGLEKRASAGRLPKAAATAYLMRSGLPKKSVKACYAEADRRKLGALDRAAFFVALKYVALSQAGRDFRRERSNTRTSLPVIDGHVITVAVAGGVPRATPSEGRSRARTHAAPPEVPASVARPRPRATTAAAPGTPARQPQQGDQYAAVNYATADSVHRSPQGGAPPIPALPPRSAEQIRYQRKQNKQNTTPHVPAVAAPAAMPAVASEGKQGPMRTPSLVERETEELNAGASTAPRRLRSMVEVEEEVCNHQHVPFACSPVLFFFAFPRE